MAKPPIPVDNLKKSAECLRVLAHYHRLRIVELLAERRLTVGAISETLGIAANAASQHLKLMQAHGLLAREREGRSVYYRIDDPSALAVLGCIREKCGIRPEPVKP